MQKNQIIEIKMMVKKDKINKAHIKKLNLSTKSRHKKA